MNPDDIKSWATTVQSALTSLATLKTLLPSFKGKEDALKGIEKAERDLKHAEASLAHELNFNLCLRCWPPEIMLIGDDDISRCRHCGKPEPGLDAGNDFIVRSY